MAPSGTSWAGQSSESQSSARTFLAWSPVGRSLSPLADMPMVTRWVGGWVEGTVGEGMQWRAYLGQVNTRRLACQRPYRSRSPSVVWEGVGYAGGPPECLPAPLCASCRLGWTLVAAFVFMAWAGVAPHLSACLPACPRRLCWTRGHSPAQTLLIWAFCSEDTMLPA